MKATVFDYRQLTYRHCAKPHHYGSVRNFSEEVSFEGISSYRKLFLLYKAWCENRSCEPISRERFEGQLCRYALPWLCSYYSTKEEEFAEFGELAIEN